MALQQINWTQIDTERVPSGSLITLASPEFPFEAVYAKNLRTSGSIIVSGSIDTTGNVIVGGNLTVKGTTTAIESNVVTIGDNIVELNGTGGAFGGLLIKDPTAPSTISGSLLWDSLNDRWIAGPLGSETPILLGGTGNTDFLQKINNSGSLIDSRISDNGTTVKVDVSDTGSLFITGAVLIRGDLIVEGKTTLVQKNDINSESLIVSGAISIVKNEIASQIKSASLSIENLGVWADRSQNAVIDCGDGFF
jgi:cytoskeletal protein CcmA (bactofilin family)